MSAQPTYLRLPAPALERSFSGSLVIGAILLFVAFLLILLLVKTPAPLSPINVGPLGNAAHPSPIDWSHPNPSFQIKYLNQRTMYGWPDGIATPMSSESVITQTVSGVSDQPLDNQGAKTK